MCSFLACPIHSIQRDRCTRRCPVARQPCNGAADTPSQRTESADAMEGALRTADAATRYTRRWRMHRSERVVKRAAYLVDLDNPDNGARDRQQQSAAIPAMPPVLFEDGELLAVDKPAGLVTHPSYKHADGTLWDAVLARQLARGEHRPCLLHRLDKWTSGVMLFAKTESARRAIVRQFERRSVGKRYLALTAGMLDPDEGEIEAPLVRDSLDRRRTIVDEGGQPALTRYRVLARATGYALVLAEPHTGRTHQIRAH